MTWIQRYRLRRFLSSPVGVAPLLSSVAALVLHRIPWGIDVRTQRAWLAFTPEGARGVVGAIASSMLTFTVFAFSILLLAVQIAGAQLSPRVMALAMRGRLLKWALGSFVFTFTHSIAVRSFIGDVVPQLPMVGVILGCFASIGMVLYRVDRTAKHLRPAGIIRSIAETANGVIEGIYPHLLAESDGVPAEQPISGSGKVSRTVYYQGTSGMFQASDGHGLAEAARRNGCTIRVVPQVGGFVTKGEPLFCIYGGGDGLRDSELHQAVAFAPERTVQQDPTFPFRIIVDIASKALSPAINDPSAADPCPRHPPRTTGPTASPCAIGCSTPAHTAARAPRSGHPCGDRSGESRSTPS